MPDATEFFERYSVPVYRFLYRMTGSEDLAADLTQDVFLRVVKGLHRYEPRGRDAAWAFRIAESVLATRYRPTSKPEEVAFSDAETVSYEPNHVLVIGLDEALRLLPRIDRDVYLLREQGGLTYAEIAELRGLTKDGVRARLRRAREHLRRLLTARLAVSPQD